MTQQPQSDNPYSSPGTNPAAAPAAGAVWEDNRVTVEFERTLEDYVIGEWFRMQHGQNGTSGLYKALTAVTIAFAVLVVLALSMGAVDWGMVWVSVLVFIFVGFVVSKRGRIRIIRRALNRLITSDAQEYLIPVRITFNQEGFDASSQWERRLRRWSAAGRLIELGDYYLFVHGGVVTLVLPKRAFAGPEETQRFLDWVRMYIPVTTN